MFSKDQYRKFSLVLLLFSLVCVIVGAAGLLLTSPISFQTLLAVGFALMSMGLFYSNQALK
jgi:energy-converting hydrogenase Eha subunit C